jgi:hypothetical protein
MVSPPTTRYIPQISFHFPWSIVLSLSFAIHDSLPLQLTVLCKVLILYLCSLYFAALRTRIRKPVDHTAVMLKVWRHPNKVQTQRLWYVIYDNGTAPPPGYMLYFRPSTGNSFGYFPAHFFRSDHPVNVLLSHYHSFQWGRWWIETHIQRKRNWKGEGRIIPFNYITHG